MAQFAGEVEVALVAVAHERDLRQCKSPRRNRSMSAYYATLTLDRMANRSSAVATLRRHRPLRRQRCGEPRRLVVLVFLAELRHHEEARLALAYEAVPSRARQCVHLAEERSHLLHDLLAPTLDQRAPSIDQPI